MSTVAGPTQVYYVDAFNGQLPSDTMQLRDGSGIWSSITVFNASSLTVLLYLNRSQSGTPDYTVAPQSFISIPTSGFQTLGIGFSGAYSATPGVTQIATITAVAQQLAASSGNIQNTFTVNVAALVTEQPTTGVPLTVSPTVTVASPFDSGVFSVAQFRSLYFLFVNAIPNPILSLSIDYYFDFGGPNEFHVPGPAIPNVASGATAEFALGIGTTGGIFPSHIRIHATVGSGTAFPIIICEGRA